MIFLYILYIIIILVVIVLVAALFLPGQYHIEKFTIIASPVTTVMDKVADLNFYAQWNPWQQTDKTSTKTITGTPKTAGHAYAWKGKKVGMGKLTLRSLDSRHVHFNLEFIKPFKSQASDDWLFEEWGSGETKVTWSNHGHLPYPLGRLMGRMIRSNLNKQFIQGLQNLKKLCETDMAGL